MKLDRNTNKDGKGKYALVRLRNIEKDSEAFAILKRLEELGHLDWGCVGNPDEFFVVKLRDKYSAEAIRAYADAVLADSNKHANEREKSDGLGIYAMQVRSLGCRAGVLSDFCKEPD